MKVRVFLATTEGVVQIERITREEARQSAICLKRTTRVLPVSAGYDAFVRPPSGVVEREFGPYPKGAFRPIVFANFCDDGDVLEIEEYLVAFSGYRHYRPIRGQQCRHEYWYESHANSARLLRNIKKMMDHLDIDARVTFSSGVFTAEQITSRN